MPVEEATATKDFSERHDMSLSSINQQSFQPELVIDDNSIDTPKGITHSGFSLDDVVSYLPNLSPPPAYTVVRNEEQQTAAPLHQTGLDFSSRLSAPVLERSPSATRGSAMEASSTPFHASEDETLQELHRLLQGMAGDRMRAMERRSSAQEESANVRRAQKELVSTVQQLLINVHECDGKISGQKLSEWQRNVASIEMLLQEADTAAKHLEKEQDRVQALEWRLCEAEEAVYAQFAVSGSQHTVSEQDEIGHFDEVPSEPASALPSSESDYPPPPVFDIQSARVDIPRRVKNELAFDSSFGTLRGADYSTLARYALRAASTPGKRDNQSKAVARYVGLSSALTTKIRLQRSAHSQPEELRCEGSQFAAYDVGSAAVQADKDHLFNNALQETAFPEYDLEGFSKWLAYGAPWIGHMVHGDSPAHVDDAIRDRDVMRTKDRAKSKEPLKPKVPPHPAATHLRFLYAWKLNSLEAICLGLPFFSQVRPSKQDDQVLAKVKRSWVRQWLWEPEMKMDISKRFNLAILSPVASMQVHATEPRTLPYAGTESPTKFRKRKSLLSIINSAASDQAHISSPNPFRNSPGQDEPAELTILPDIPIID